MSDTSSAETFARAYFESQSQEHRDNVVFASEPVIRSIISKIRVPGEDLAKPDELFQIGVIAVLQALDQFVPSPGARFITFAYPRIRGEIIDYLRRLDPLPRRRRMKVARARQSFDRAAQTSGSSPSESAVAAMMGVEVAEYRSALVDSTRRYVTYLFDDRGDEEEGLRLVDMMEDQSALCRFDNMEWEDIRRYLDQLSEGLTERDRTIIELNYGEDLTLAEIGSLLGISEARVSQLRKAILFKLNRKVERSLRPAA